MKRNKNRETNLEVILHRINTISELKNIESKYGVEIDIRAWGSELVLNHEPFQDGEKLVDYLDEYHHGTLVLNVKENGIEDEILHLVRERPQLNSYFLLDVEFPYIYRASRLGEKNIAIRFSEDESLETVENYIGKVDWVWIDTNTLLPISKENKLVLDKFKKCLVCPERWGRPSDIIEYKNKVGTYIDAVMTDIKYIDIWIS
jgi:hypothetical protein